MIPLKIDFTQQPPEGIRFEKGIIYMNTKDPDIALKMHDRIISEVTNLEDIEDLSTLFLNHRLREASDLDLFDKLEDDLDEEIKMIEIKNERMSRVSLKMS